MTLRCTFALFSRKKNSFKSEILINYINAGIELNFNLGINEREFRIFSRSALILQV